MSRIFYHPEPVCNIYRRFCLLKAGLGNLMRSHNCKQCGLLPRLTDNSC